MQLRLAVELGPGDATLGARGAGRGIDVNAFHRQQINHQPAVDGRAPRYVVAAATDRHLKVHLSRESDGVDNVGHATTSGNQCWAFVHQTVVDFPFLLVARIGGLQELPRELAGKLDNSVGNGWNGRHGVCLLREG